MMINKTLLLTYLYLLIYILLSSGVILYNTWVLSPKYFNFPFPITLTMIHMGFAGMVAFILVRVLKVVAPVKMTFKIYATCVIPISAFFASSLWFGNTAYLHISVAFIQMLKALMPVATFLMAVVCGTDKLRLDIFFNMVLVSVGVVISSYGEIHFNIVGTVYQVTGIFAEALRLALTQVLLQKKGLTLNPITSLYYIAPCSFMFLFVPWYLLEKHTMEISQIQFNFWIFFSNAFCALALNLSIFLVIGRTGAITFRVAGVMKDWILIALSTIIFPESSLTGLNIIGYAIALCGVALYNYLKVKDARMSSQLPMESLPERSTKGTVLGSRTLWLVIVLTYYDMVSVILTSFSCYFYNRSRSLTGDHLIYTSTSAIMAMVEATVMGPHLILTSAKKHLSFHLRDCLTLAEASSAAILRKIIKIYFHVQAIILNGISCFPTRGTAKGSIWLFFVKEMLVRFPPFFFKSVQCMSQNIIHYLQGY